MPPKSVRFSDSNQTFPYISTPSPSFSISSLPDSSTGPATPPPGNDSTARSSPYAPFIYLSTRDDNPDDDLPDGTVLIHKILGLSQSRPFKFDISVSPPVLPSSLTPLLLSSAATTPPLPSVRIVCTHLPWALDVLPDSPKPAAFVSVADLLTGLARALRLPVTEAEYTRELPDKRARIQRAFEERCAKSGNMQEERRKGIKRVDFLVGDKFFVGLSRTDRGPDVWKLSVADRAP